MGASNRKRRFSAPPEGSITYRFHGRDLRLVLGPSADGKPVRLQLTIDGHAPGQDRGVDDDAAGDRVVMGRRLYQLAGLTDRIEDHTFEIRFRDAGGSAYSFTFG
jgi:hypothetical protein